MLIILSFIIGALIVSSLSIAILKRLSWQEFILTLYATTAPIPFLAYTNASLIKYYLGLLAVSSISLPITRRKQYLAVATSLRKEMIGIAPKDFASWISASAIIVLFLTWYQAPWNWQFESHDVLYYGWINEVFKASYNGAIRVSTAYPTELSANHLLPGAILLPFLGLTQKAPFIAAYWAKYLLTSFSLIWLGFQLRIRVNNLNFSSRGIKDKSQKLRESIYFAILFITPFLLYGPEFEYNASVSSFAVIIPMLAAASLAIETNIRRDEKKPVGVLSVNEKIIFLFVCAVLCKGKYVTCFSLTVIATLIPWRNLAKFPVRGSKAFTKAIKNYLKREDLLNAQLYFCWEL